MSSQNNIASRADECASERARKREKERGEREMRELRLRLLALLCVSRSEVHKQMAKDRTGSQTYSLMFLSHRIASRGKRFQEENEKAQESSTPMK